MDYFITGNRSCFIVGYIFKAVMKEIKKYREESLAQRAEFNDALNNKFKSINFYMRQTDKLQVKQEHHIETLNNHAKETKLKLLSHEERLNKHNEQLIGHELEIKNLKRTG